MSRRGTGVTLVETVLSLLILGGAFASALTAIGSARGAQMSAADRRLALVLAEDLMTEILAEPAYKEGSTFGHESGEAIRPRSAFDDMDDYNAWTTRTLVDIDGNAIPGADRYTREVQIVYVDPANPERRVSSDQGLALIIVQVKYSRRIVAEVRAYRSDVWRSPEEDY